MADTKDTPAVVPAPAIDPNAEYVIVLEDSVPNRNILVSILNKIGFDCLVGKNGMDGLKYLQKCEDEKLNLVLIISDIMMPQLDGIEFLNETRKRDVFRKTPFLIVSATSDSSNIIEAKRKNVAGYLLKPITLDQIKVKLKEIFPGREFSTRRRVA
jgi:two-component system chemotaxis response regulator CheY